MSSQPSLPLPDSSLPPPPAPPSSPHGTSPHGTSPHGVEEAKLQDHPHHQNQPPLVARVPERDQESEAFRMLDGEEMASGSPTFNRYVCMHVHAHVHVHGSHR